MSDPMEQGKVYRYLGQGRHGLPSQKEFPPYIYDGGGLSHDGAQNPGSRGANSFYFEEVEASGQWQWTLMGGSIIPGGGGEILYKTFEGNISSNPLNAKYWMQLPPDPKPALPESIWINSSRKAHVDAEGNVKVGCEAFSYERIVELVELAKKTREENA